MFRVTKKKILSAAIVFLMVLCVFTGVSALGNDTIAYAEGVELYLTNAAPSNLSELQAANDEQLDHWAQTLAKFDGRTYNYVTSTKDQGSKPTCWAYSAVGVAEANILRAGIDSTVTKNNLDFDEDYATWITRNRDGVVDPLGNTNDDIMSYNAMGGGGNVEDAFAAMSQGYGLNAEGTATDSFIKSKYIVENIKGINASQTDIKKAIIKYGAVAFDYKSSGSFVTYYKSSGASDHVSIIVGWDDTIAASNFGASTNGAWIVKNSWGNYGVNVNGVYCFYLSYESEIYDVYTADFAINGKYENCYYYDGTIGETSVTSTFLYNEFAAIYQAKKASATNKELLNAVHVGIKGGNVTCEIKIYTGLKNLQPGDVNSILNDPTKGELKHTQTENFASRGSYTVRLNKEIELEVGEWFSIVVKVTNQAGDATVLTGSDYRSINDMTYYFDSDAEVWRNCKYSSARPYVGESANKEVAKIRAFTYTEKRASALDNDMSNALILINNRFEYYEQNKPFEPDVQVYFGNNLLVEGVDYDLEYKDNIYAGDRNIVNGLNEQNIVSAKAIVHGKGKYSGSRQELFFVARALNATLPKSEITVYNDVERLSQVLLPANWKWFAWPSAEETRLSFGTDIYNAVYEGDDANCYRNLWADVYITRLNQDPPQTTSISDCDITITGTYTYTGSAIIPNVEVSHNGVPLTLYDDYTINCKNNINAGVATVEITGIGSYADTVTRQFNIAKAVRTVTATIQGWTYGESANSPVIVWDNGDKTANILYRAVGSDEYDSVVPTNAGAYQVKITLPQSQNYEGKEIILEFTIAKAAKPSFDGNTQIEVDSDKEKLNDVELPANWQWKNSEAEISDNMTAIAQYVGEDKDNYENIEVEIHITRSAQTQPENPPEGGEQKPDDGDDDDNNDPNEGDNTGGDNQDPNEGDNSGDNKPGEGDNTGDNNKPNEGDNSGEGNGSDNNGDGDNDKTEDNDNSEAENCAGACGTISFGGSGGGGLGAGLILFITAIIASIMIIFVRRKQNYNR